MTTLDATPARYTGKVIRCRLRYLLERKADREGRKKRYTIRDVSEETKLSTNVINRYINNKFDKVDRHTMDVLCKYLDCELGELFVYEEPTDEGADE